jgi:P-type Cu2+ transporter
MSNRRHNTPPAPAPNHSAASCRHCGTPLTAATTVDSAFCCHGCAYVYQMIQQEGLGDYYQLRDRTISPVAPGALELRDYRWLDRLVAATEADQPQLATLDLAMQGISCLGCVWLVERLFHREQGAVRIDIEAHSGRIAVTWRPRVFDLLAFAREIQKFGYLLAPAGQRPPAETKRMAVRMGLSGAFALNGMIFTLPRYLGMQQDFELAATFEGLTLLFATLSLLAGGSYFVRRAWESVRAGVLHIDLPIALGIVLAYIGSVVGWLLAETSWLYFDFVCIFIFLMLVGRWIQERAIEFNRHRMVRNSPLASAVQWVDPVSGTRSEVALSSLSAGQTLHIEPGSVIPVTSRLLSPAASCSLEWINGESAARTFTTGDRVPGGSIFVGRSPLLVSTLEPWTGSLLATLLAQTGIQPRNRLLESVLRYYLVAVLVVAAAGGALWLALPWGGWVPALQVVLSILVVSCPCALGVAAPMAQEWAVGILRQAGVFVREPSLFARMAKVRRIVLDKTGTLTLEAPQLANADVLASLNPEAIQALRLMVEDSLHPVGRALREALRALPPPMAAPAPDPAAVSETVGMGLSLTDAAGRRWSLGRPGWRGSNNELPADGWDAAGDCELACDGHLVAAFHLRESLRAEAVATIATLQRQYQIAILSGDRTAKVRHMAERLGLDPACAIGDQLPAGKARMLGPSAKLDTLFIGDGANDSLAFDAALVTGTPVVERSILESKSDFFFTGKGLSGLLRLTETCRLRNRVVREVFGMAVGYNLAVVAIALAGHMNPLLAAILMPSSSLVTLAWVWFRFKQRQLG